MNANKKIILVVGANRLFERSANLFPPPKTSFRWRCLKLIKNVLPKNMGFNVEIELGQSFPFPFATQRL